MAQRRSSFFSHIFVGSNVVGVDIGIGVGGVGGVGAVGGVGDVGAVVLWGVV